jgi:hypothetical protein
MSYYIFDDMFPEKLVSDIENLLTSFPFDWHFVDLSSGSSINANNPLQKDCSQMIHMFCKGDEWSSPYSDIVQSMIAVIKEETDILSIHKIKANLTIPDGTSSEHYNAPHQDHEQDNFLSMVYYVHDSDGDTILFDRQNRLGELNQLVRITPSRGRCVVFPSKQFHSSSNPTMFKNRIILNFTFQV